MSAKVLTPVAVLLFQVPYVLVGKAGRDAICQGHVVEDVDKDLIGENLEVSSAGVHLGLGPATAG